MKNLKNYFASTVLLLFFCTLPFACTTENAVSDNQNAENKNTQDLTVKPNTKKPAGTVCSYIQDANPAIITLTPETLADLCIPDAKAVITAGTSTTYKFIIGGVQTSGQWIVYSGSGITFNGGSSTATGSTVTVNFASGFTAGSIQVVGTDSTGQIYGPILNISKTNGSGTACDCLPILKAQYINNDGSISGSTRGEFWFESPSTCTVDWMNINTIKLQLGGISFGVGSNTSVKINANSYNNWTNTPTSPAYYNMRILTNNNTTLPVAAPGGLFTFPNSPGSAFEGWATITFKNGCPAQTIYTVYGGIE